MVIAIDAGGGGGEILWNYDLAMGCQTLQKVFKKKKISLL